MTTAALTELLTTDPSAWVDTSGAVFFKEATAPAPADDPVSAQAPLDQTFQLHSKPGSTKTIFLDVDGGTASATGWHASYPATPTSQPAWDPSGNGAGFADSELTSIQTIWQAVAEDYAPFDVDVTTADPGAAGIHRSSVLDPTYGSHVLITPSIGAHDAICNPLNDGSACGGVAYINVFDAVNGGGWGAGGDGYGYRSPPGSSRTSSATRRRTSPRRSRTRSATTSVCGTTATPPQGYDRGHGAWAPIMGVGYDHPISQWSKGDYAGAEQHGGRRCPHPRGRRRPASTRRRRAPSSPRPRPRRDGVRHQPDGRRHLRPRHVQGRRHDHGRARSPRSRTSTSS